MYTLHNLLLSQIKIYLNGLSSAFPTKFKKIYLQQHKI